MGFLMIELLIEAESELVGRRLDQVLATTFPTLSRTEIQQEIRAGKVTVSGDVIEIGRAHV